ncbi:hypothetical protein OZ411_35930 [Bradyrhizobium sp. Arg237L]|uniref:hypothetical protein n=1 Tax=Bradyrhizobium sp. Arg237L TaxID=3003352 RepID=UPI00249F5C8C|nr:hypothetical protein [Bradyrhizobium sp. Arg237L]MDI4238204.1 hypothetical protein [Bradyrhizobium sp. Arg237L]
MRGLLMLCGLVGVLWSLTALPSFRLTTSARDIIAGIIADQRFKPGVLENMLERMEVAPQQFLVSPEFSQAKALLRLSTAEEVLQRKSPEEGDAAQATLKSALSLNPTDSFLWMMLYSAETARNGFDAQYLGYIDQSYAVGPLEGWIALRRNRLALAIFAMLSDATQTAVVSEFAELVDADFIEQAVINLTTVGWGHRARLLAGVERLDIADRESLARRLSRDGLKLAIPGIDQDGRAR